MQSRGSRLLKVGDSFGRLTVLVASSGIKNRAHMALFRCDCGAEKEIAKSNVFLGKSKSCGCLSKEVTGDRARTHGMSKTKEYQTWSRMWSRCINPIVDRYPRYGGRGIKVCDRWKKFELFYEDMGPIPSPSHSIGRIDNDGNYEPSNCRWETPEQQCSNTSVTRIVEWKSEKKTIRQWSIETGITYSRLAQRLAAGLPAEKVFDDSPDSLALRKITVDGVTKLTTEWMRDANIPISSFYYWQRKGLSKEDIVEKYLAKLKGTK